jgi:hypothetical protein
MILSAKEMFLSSTWKVGMEKIAMTEDFMRACDYALLSLQEQMLPTTRPDRPTDPYVGLDANSQMMGAMRVIAILKELHLPMSAEKKKAEPSLYH